MDRLEWLAARRRGIGGSDAATLFDANPYQSRLSLYLSKVTEEPPEEEEDNDPMMLGTMLEAGVRDFYQYKTGRKVGAGVVLYSHPDYPFMLANTDGTIDPIEGYSTNGVYEGKITTQLWRGAKTNDAGLALTSGAEGVPLYHQIQMQHDLATLGWEWGAFACLMMGKRGDPLARQDVERNERFIAELRRREEQFWNDHVIPRRPPPADGSKATEYALKHLYPKADGKVYSLPRGDAQLLDDWLEAKAQAASWGKDARALKNKLVAQMGSNEYLVQDGVEDPNAVALTLSEQRRAAQVKDVYRTIAEVVDEDLAKQVQAKVEQKRKTGRTLLVSTLDKVKSKAVIG